MCLLMLHRFIHLNDVMHYVNFNGIALSVDWCCILWMAWVKTDVDTSVKVTDLSSIKWTMSTISTKSKEY